MQNFSSSGATPPSSPAGGPATSATSSVAVPVEGAASADDTFRRMVWHPERGTTALALRIAREAERIDGVAWRGEADIGMDGNILFRFQRPGNSIHVEWLGGDGFSVPNVPGFFAIRRLERKAAEGPIFRAMGSVLAAAARNPWLARLAPVANNPSISFKQGLRQLAKDWLPLDHGGWYDFNITLAEYGDQEGLLRLTYQSPTRRVVVSVQDCDAAVGDRMTGYGNDVTSAANVVFSGHGFFAHIVYDNRSAEERGRVEFQPHRAVAFACARVDPLVKLTKRQEKAPAGRKEGVDETEIVQLMTHGAKEILPYEAASEAQWQWNTMAEGNLVNKYLFAATIDNEERAPLVMFCHKSCLSTFISIALFEAAIPAVNTPYDWARKRMAHSGSAFNNVADMDETSASMDGGTKVLAETVAAVDEKRNGEGMILTMDTCVSKLIGSPTDDPVRDLGVKPKTTFVKLYPKQAWPDEMADGPARAYRQLLRLAEDLPRSMGPSVNLIGFPDRRDSDELTALIQSLGIEVNAHILPRFNLDDGKRYRRAWAQVFMPDRSLKALYLGTFLPTGLPPAGTGHPTGIDDSFAWLKSISESLGMTDRFEEWSQHHLAAWAERRAAMRERTRGRTVGFVVGVENLSRVWDHHRAFGVSPLRLLKEMGFDVAIYLPVEGDQVDAAPKLVERYLPDVLKPFGVTLDQFSVHPFAGGDAFEALLRNGPADVLFSDIHPNPRIELSGRSCFSLRDLERGPEGAIRTAERLLRRLETPYWRRFAQAHAGV